MNWVPAAKKYPDTLSEYLNKFIKKGDPEEIVGNEWLLGRLAAPTRWSTEVSELFESWLDGATTPTVIEKLVEALDRSAHPPGQATVRMLKLIAHKNPAVQLAAAKKLRNCFYYREPLEAVMGLLEARREAQAALEELQELESIVAYMRDLATLERRTPMKQ